ncbi:MAG: DnaJ C-terminal domain-containing protein, partial [bacterium]
VQYAQGFFALSQTCTDCGGHGEVVEIPCKDCHGSGRSSKKVSLNIKVPAGIHDGSSLRVQHAGEAGPRSVESGDLYVQVHLKHHSVFERSGDDLTYNCTVSFPKAALGCSEEIPAISGEKTNLDIRAGTQNDTVFRVKGQGMPIMGTRKRGDLMVNVRVEVPRHLNHRQKELLTELAASFNEEISEKEGAGFFKKVFGSNSQK